MVEQTSLLAYAQIQSKLGAMQQAVYDVIEEFGPIADLDISVKLNNKPINSITPRRRELVLKGFVIQHGRGVNSFGNSAELWVIKDPNDSTLLKIAKEPLEQDCE